MESNDPSGSEVLANEICRGAGGGSYEGYGYIISRHGHDRFALTSYSHCSCNDTEEGMDASTMLSAANLDIMARDIIDPEQLDRKAEVCDWRYAELKELYQEWRKWRENNVASRDDIFTAFSDERYRQDQLHGAYKPGDMTNEKLLTLLAEEVGEVAKAINDGDAINMAEELVQVGALAVAWLELLR